MDINDLTLGEISVVEQYAGISIDQAEEAPKGKLLASWAYVVKRRTEPKYKYEDALKLTPKEATAIIGIVEDPKD